MDVYDETEICYFDFLTASLFPGLHLRPPGQRRCRSGAAGSGPHRRGQGLAHDGVRQLCAAVRGQRGARQARAEVKV